MGWELFSESYSRAWKLSERAEQLDTFLKDFRCDKDREEVIRIGEDTSRGGEYGDSCIEYVVCKDCYETYKVEERDGVTSRAIGTFDKSSMEAILNETEYTVPKKDNIIMLLRSQGETDTQILELVKDLS